MSAKECASLSSSAPSRERPGPFARYNGYGASMTRSILAHFDGRVIVPDEPVDLPTNAPLRLDISRMPTAKETDSGDPIAEQARRIRALEGMFSGPTLPDEALRRESIYADDE